MLECCHTYLVLLILQCVMFFFALHHHLFYLPLQPAVHQLQVGTLPETQAARCINTHVMQHINLTP